MAAQKIIIAVGSLIAESTLIKTYSVKSELEHGKKVCVTNVDSHDNVDDTLYINLEGKQL